MSAAPMPMPELVREHGVFLREFGRAQERVTRLLAHKEAQVQMLADEVVRLRGQLLAARKALDSQPRAQLGAVARGAPD